MKPTGKQGMRARCKYIVGHLFWRRACGDAVGGRGGGGLLFCPKHRGKYFELIRQLEGRGYLVTAPRCRAISDRLMGKS
jgi:hypothetical protein